MVDDPYVRIGARELVGDFRGRVRAAVVDDDHLVVRRQRRRGLDGADDHAGDRPAVVERGKEDADTRRLTRLLWHGETGSTIARNRGSSPRRRLARGVRIRDETPRRDGRFEQHRARNLRLAFTPLYE